MSYLKNIEQIYITQGYEGYIYLFNYELLYSNTRKQINTGKINTYNLEQLIVSMSAVKIKNYLIKEYNAQFYNRIPIFKTEKEAGEALKWIKQKSFETTLIGIDTLKVEKEKKEAENKLKRQKKEIENANNIALKTILQISSSFGKEITFPITIGDKKQILQLKTKLINISFNFPDYIFQTEAGNFQVNYKFITIANNRILSLRGGFHNTPKVEMGGELEIFL